MEGVTLLKTAKQILLASQSPLKSARLGVWKELMAYKCWALQRGSGQDSARVLGVAIFPGDSFLPVSLWNTMATAFPSCFRERVEYCSFSLGTFVSYVLLRNENESL